MPWYRSPSANTGKPPIDLSPPDRLFPSPCGSQVQRVLAQCGGWCYLGSVIGRAIRGCSSLQGTTWPTLTLGVGTGPWAGAVSWSWLLCNAFRPSRACLGQMWETPLCMTGFEPWGRNKGIKVDSSSHSDIGVWYLFYTGNSLC